MTNNPLHSFILKPYDYYRTSGLSIRVDVDHFGQGEWAWARIMAVPQAGIVDQVGVPVLDTLVRELAAHLGLVVCKTSEVEWKPLQFTGTKKAAERFQRTNFTALLEAHLIGKILRRFS